MATDQADPGTDRRMRRARLATLVSLATGVWVSVLLPAVGLTREPAASRVALGAVGIAVFATAQGAALHAAVTPWLTDRARRRRRLGFAVAALLSVPLVGPLAAGAWPSWAWLGASIIGSVPLLARWRVVLGTAVATVAVALAVAWSTGGSAGRHLLVTGGVGLGVAAVTGFQVWFWDLLVQARQGQEASARLAAVEERLRFARDVHDLLGHNLTVIALKAELAARLAPVDAERAGREADEVRRLAASALDEVREAVHGYRRVDLAEQVAAVGQVLRSSGVRCEVVPPAGELPAETATQLAAVLREASTNVLRHSRAGWCRIEIHSEGSVSRMTVTNDGAADAVPDGRSHGLRGLAERLSAGGGALRVHRDGDLFTVEATVPAAA